MLLDLFMSPLAAETGACLECGMVPESVVNTSTTTCDTPLDQVLLLESEVFPESAAMEPPQNRHKMSIHPPSDAVYIPRPPLVLLLIIGWDCRNIVSLLDQECTHTTRTRMRTRGMDLRTTGYTGLLFVLLKSTVKSSRSFSWLSGTL